MMQFLILNIGALIRLVLSLLQCYKAKIDENKTGVTLNGTYNVSEICRQ